MATPAEDTNQSSEWVYSSSCLFWFCVHCLLIFHSWEASLSNRNKNPYTTPKLAVISQLYQQPHSLNLRTGKREGFYLEMKILNIKLCLPEYTLSGSKNRCTYGVLGRAQNCEFNFKEAFSYVCREAFSSITEWSMSLAVGSIGTVQARALQWTYTLVHVELFFMELMNSAMMFIAVGHIIAAIYDYP